MVHRNGSSSVRGNLHERHDCPYCWRVLYSQSALTQHINNEHWWKKEEELAEMLLKVKPEEQNAS